MYSFILKVVKSRLRKAGLNIDQDQDDYKTDRTTDEHHRQTEKIINTQDKTYVQKPHSTHAGEKTVIKSNFDTNKSKDDKRETTTTKHVSNIEAVKQNMTGRSDSRSKVIASDPDVSRLVDAAVDKYLKRDYDQMTKHLDDAEEKEGSCDVRLAFAGHISTEFHLVTFSNNIPEESGLSTVEETTQKYLLYLANGHQNVMKLMNEILSDDMKKLTVDLFTLPNVMPGTDSWIQLERNAKQMVQYFESLTKNGQSVTKSCILLFLTVIHNFIATRKRLRRTEHFRLLPFILLCRVICESKLLESKAWIKTKFEVYEIVVLTTGASLETGQILCDPRYPDYLKMYDELVERGKQYEIELTNANKQEHIDIVRQEGLNLCNGTEDRMCITSALLYHRAGCYKGLMLILNAANQTRSVQNIRMNFTKRLSHTFERCVDYRNKISDANTYEELVEKSYHYLSTAAKDLLKFVENMGEKTSNDLILWVDEVFQATNDKPELYPVLEIESVIEKCNMASVSIQRMSEEAKCISQTYLEFFMSFIMNFLSRRNQLHVKDVYTGGLKILLAVIMLCKDILVTSNFSVKQKQSSYNVAAAYMTQMSDDDVWIEEMEFVINELPNLKLQRKKFDEICRKREREKNVWPNNERQTEQRKTQDQTPWNTEIVGLYEMTRFYDYQADDILKKEILLGKKEKYEYEHILSWSTFSTVCMHLDVTNDARRDWRALAEEMGVNAETIEVWHQNKGNPTKTLLEIYINEGKPRKDILHELVDTLKTCKLGRAAELVEKDIHRPFPN